MAFIASYFLTMPSFAYADTWDPVTISGYPTTGSFSSVAYGNVNGNGTYVATRVQTQNNTPSAGRYRFTGRIFTSPDLSNWTEQVPTIVFEGSGNYGTCNFSVMPFTTGSNKFIAWLYCPNTTGTVSTSKILSSANGSTWTEVYSGSDAYLSVTNQLSGYYSTHVARAYDTSSNTTTINYKIRFSPDSSTWTERHGGTYFGTGNSFSYGFSVGRYDQGYVAPLYIQNTSTSPSTITGKVFFSTDGITWTERFSGNGAITSFGGLGGTLAVPELIPPAIAGSPVTARILTTADWGETWTERYSQTFGGTATFVVQSNGNSALVGWIGITDDSGNYQVKILGSSDGNTWNETYSNSYDSSGNNGISVNYANPYFTTRVLVNPGGATASRFLISPTGSAWTESYTGSGNYTTNYRNGTFLAWGSNGTNPSILRYTLPVTVWLAATIKEPLTETPISGGTVSLVEQPGITTTIAADGHFTLTGINPGAHYTLKVAKAGYWPLYYDGLPYSPPGSPDYTINNRFTNALSLIPSAQVADWGVSPTKGVVALRLVDATTPSTGNVSGAIVTATGQPSGKTYTASYFDTPYIFSGTSTYTNGRVFFLNVDDGDTLTVNASATGWSFSEQTFKAFAGGVTGVAFPGLPTGATYPISGVVRDISSNVPLGGASVKIFEVGTGAEKVRARTSEAGYYMASLRSPGNYTIGVTRPGYDSASFQDVIALSDISPNTTRFIGLTQAESSLSSGWNFVSFASLPPTGGTIAAVFGEAYPAVNVVWGWDNQNKVWKKWKRGAGSNTLTTIGTDKGYWVYMDQSTTLDTIGWVSPPSTTIHLYESWNLVGYLGADNNGAAAALGPIAGKWIIVWGWDNGAWSAKHETISSLPAPIQPLANFHQGKAYWIRIRTASDWTQ